LTANLNQISKEKDQLIESRMAGFRSAKLNQAQIDSGAMVYVTYCTMCHRRVSKDGVGPPLAGIGKRGAKSIIEKIIDPNRNITEAFRNYTVKTKDGKVINGVFRRDEGKVAVYADVTGTEIFVPKADIVEAKLSPFTIMPETFGTSISQHELNKLIAYLLTY
jgi:putative heme-binding domain-containing protein